MRDRVMYQNLRIITPPAVDPVFLHEAKGQVRNLIDAENPQIEGWIEAATAYLDGRDGILGRALITQTWEYVLDEFPIGGRLYLPLPPVQSITSITYRDTDGNLQTFGAGNYALSADKQWRPFVSLVGEASWPGTDDDADAVIVRAVHGYGSAGTDVPVPIRQAILLLVAHQYLNREPLGDPATELPFGLSAMLQPYMVTAF